MRLSQGPIKQLDAAEKISAYPSSLFWMLQLFSWGGDPTPSQHLAWLCQSRRLCRGIALAGLDSLLLSGASRPPSTLPGPDCCSPRRRRGTLSPFPCLADPELQLCSVSSHFPFLLCLYLLCPQPFLRDFLKNGSIFPITTVHSRRSTDK